MKKPEKRQGKAEGGRNRQQVQKQAEKAEKVAAESTEKARAEKGRQGQKKAEKGRKGQKRADTGRKGQKRDEARRAENGGSKKSASENAFSGPPRRPFGSCDCGVFVSKKHTFLFTIHTCTGVCLVSWGYGRWHSRHTASFHSNHARQTNSTLVECWCTTHESQPQHIAILTYPFEPIG